MKQESSENRLDTPAKDTLITSIEQLTKRVGFPEIVVWNDHGVACGWYEHEDVEPTASIYPVTSFGWPVKETKEVLVLAGTVSGDNTTSATRQYILKSCIVERKKVKV